MPYVVRDYNKFALFFNNIPNNWIWGVLFAIDGNYLLSITTK